jgi:hypothetical protein
MNMGHTDVVIQRLYIGKVYDAATVDSLVHILEARGDNGPPVVILPLG